MSFSLNKLRSFFPGQSSSSSNVNKQRHSVSLEPEIGFQISIASTPSACEGAENAVKYSPELNVVLIAARHLPTVFGFKMVQGYNIKVKLFPGSKRFDSSVQTNSWPKFNESFKFLLAPDIKSSIKTHAKSKTASEFLPEEIITGHFVVFTVYALLELPPASFNRFNKTYRSLKERSSSLVQKVVDSGNKSKNEDAVSKSKDGNSKATETPQLTISESKRNIGSVTCYLEPKVFKRNSRTGQFCTDELWLPIKDINTSVLESSNNLACSSKGVIEVILELQDILKDNVREPESQNSIESKDEKTTSKGSKRQWAGLSEVRRRIGISNAHMEKGFNLKVITSRMRCSNKVKDELESSAGSVYIKTTVFEHNIYSDSWKSTVFFPSLSIKWHHNTSTIDIPIKFIENLNHVLIKTTLATKNKIGKKIVLGTVLIGSSVSGSGLEHWQNLEGTRNEKLPMWHRFQ